MMLSNEQVSLLRWIAKQSNAVSHKTMERLSAPEYSASRIEELRKGEYIKRSISVEEDDVVGVYTIADKGLALLQQIEKACEKEAEDKRQRRFQNQVSVAQVLVPAITFVLGLIVEHYAGLIAAFSELFGRWVK